MKIFIASLGLSVGFLINDITYRDVSTGATGATEVAPKFSDTLTLSPPGGAEFAHHLNFPRGYVPALV